MRSRNYEAKISNSLSSRGSVSDRGDLDSIGIASSFHSSQ